MTKNFIFGLFALATSFGCCPPAPPQQTCQICIDFEPPLTAGTQYGTPAGQTPGTVIFTHNSIAVTVRDFVFVGGGGSFDAANIEIPPVPFGNNQTIRTNNINLEFDFSAIGFQPSEVMIEFLDQGGFENLAVSSSRLVDRSFGWIIFA